MDKILWDILKACAFSAFAGASAFVISNCMALHAPLFVFLIFTLLLIVFAGLGILAALRAFARIRQAQNIRLGMRGEQVVAEALTEVADCGFRAFHDLPGGRDWNIDHVAVGTRGVFLIETKARRRRASRTGQAAHEVIYDGESLQFPFYKDVEPIEQAKRNAKWLANYLGKKTGETVWVEPLVVLPGWFVRATKKGNFPVKVMNATYLARFLRGHGEHVEAAQVRRIITALDEKCRDVEF